MIPRFLNTPIVFFINCIFSSFVAGAPPTAPIVPVAVGGAAFGKANTRLLVAGGMALTNGQFGSNLNQFFALDLAVPWTASSPTWIALSNKGAPTQSLFTGAVSADGSLFVTFRSGSILSYRYSVDKDVWSPSSVAVQDPQRVGIFAAADLSAGNTSGNVYLAGGYQEDDTQMYVYNMATDSMLPNFAIPNTSLLDRNSYSAVYVKSRQSIFYFGGISRNGVTSPGNLTEFVPSTQAWSTVNIAGVAGTNMPLHRVNLCMAVNDNGTKVVVFGGMLDNDIPATDIWVLDVPTLTWTMGPMNQQPRWNPVCGIAGNTFVAWGGFNSTSSVESMVLYDIGLNQMVYNYSPPASYLNEEANSKSSRNIVIISICSVLAAVIAAGLAYWIIRRRKANQGSYLVVGSNKRKRASESGSSVTLRDSILSFVSESANPMKSADYLESPRKEKHPHTPNGGYSYYSPGSGPQSSSSTIQLQQQLLQQQQVLLEQQRKQLQQLQQLQKLKQPPREPQQKQRQQEQQPQQLQENRVGRYDFDPYPIRDVQDPHAYRPQHNSISVALHEKRLLQREIEKQKLELELQRQQMQLQQQRHELLNGAGYSSVRGAGRGVGVGTRIAGVQTTNGRGSSR